MKKVRKEIVKRYPLKRLYRDDIEEIINIFEKNFSGKYDTYIDEYQMEDIKDLDNIRSDKIRSDKIKSFKITCQTQKGTPWIYMSVILGKDSSRLYLSHDADTNINGVVFEIDRLISNKKCLVGTIFSHSIIVTILLFLLQVVNFTLALSINQHSLLYIVLNRFGIIGGFITVFWIVSAYFLYFFRHNIIYMAYSNAKSNFFTRNGDQIILSLFSAFIGFGLGILASYIVYMLTPAK